MGVKTQVRHFSECVKTILSNISIAFEVYFIPKIQICNKLYILSAVNYGIFIIILNVLTIPYCQIKSEIIMGATIFSQKQPEYNVYFRFSFDNNLPYYHLIMMRDIILSLSAIILSLSAIILSPSVIILSLGAIILSLSAITLSQEISKHNINIRCNLIHNMPNIHFLFQSFLIFLMGSKIGCTKTYKLSVLILFLQYIVSKFCKLRFNEVYSNLSYISQVLAIELYPYSHYNIYNAITRHNNLNSLCRQKNINFIDFISSIISISKLLTCVVNISVLTYKITLNAS